MASRIVSWSDNEICISPVLSSTASIISFDSTFSDTHPSYWQMSPTSDALKVPSSEFGAKHTSIPWASEEGRTPRGGHTTPDESFVRHDAYFFKDGNVTFLIDGTLYCVHRYFFSRDSVYFSTRFAKLGIRDHEALPTIISISDVERNDFEALLFILYPTNFEAHELTYEQWKSVLHLSTRWGFASLRKLALKSIKPLTSHDQLVLARTYSVEHWVLPALTALCARTLPLSLDEARQMSMEDVILVATVREEIRGGVLRVDVADIPYYMTKTEARVKLGKLEAATKAKADTDAMAKAEAKDAEAEAKAEAETREKHEADAKAEAEAREIAEAGAKEKREGEAKSEAEVDAKIAVEVKIKVAKEAKVAAAKAELDTKQKAEKERLELKAEAARAKGEWGRVETEKAEKAARAAANTSASSPMNTPCGESSWLSKITTASVIIPSKELASPWDSDPWSKRYVKNASSSPSTELDPLRGPGAPGTPIQHSSTTSSPHGSASTHSATSITTAPSLATVVWQERKPTSDKLDDKTGDRKGNQVTAVLPADAATDICNQAKCEAPVATANIHVPSKATDKNKTCDVVGSATAPDAPGDKYADSAPTPCKAESTRAQETAPAEVVVGSWPSKDLGTPALPLPLVTSCQPRSLPGSLPFPEYAASASAKPNVDPETQNVLDSKNAEETPAQTKALPAVQDGGVKPDGATTGPTLQLSQRSDAASWGSAITKGSDADAEGLVKPTLYPDHIREASTALAMSESGLGAPVDETPSSSLETRDDGDASGAKRLSKVQIKRMREKARKQQARMYEKSGPCSASGETSNSVNNPVVQEPKPVATALVDIPVGEGEGVRVDAKAEHGRDEALVIVDRPDSATTTAETAATHATDDDELWSWW